MPGALSGSPTVCFSISALVCGEFGDEPGVAVVTAAGFAASFEIGLTASSAGFFGSAAPLGATAATDELGTPVGFMASVLGAASGETGDALATLGE